MATGLGQMFALVFVAGVSVGTLVAAIWWYTCRQHIRELPPNQRLRRLVLLVSLPPAAGTLLIGVILIPSGLDALGIATDHCHAHANHHLHLCLVHAHPVAPSPIGWILIGIPGIWMLLRFISPLERHLSTRGHLRHLRSLGESRGDLDARVVPSNRVFAVTTGFVSPEVFVSTALIETFCLDKCHTIVAHEKAHAEKRHGLIQMGVELLALFHLPPVAKWLRRETEIACEQIADQAAAETSDRIQLAELIVSAERHKQRSPATAPTAFTDGQIERRVVGLLDRPWSSFSNWWLRGGFAVAITVAFVEHRAIHHGVETALAFFI